MLSMPKFTLEHSTPQPAEKAFQKIKEIMTKGDDIKKYDPSIQCEFDEAQMTCHIKGSQFKAEMKVAAVEPGSKVIVTVDLPLLLTPFKSKVQDSLARMLGKHLG